MLTLFKTLALVSSTIYASIIFVLFHFFSSNFQYWKALKARSNIVRKCFEYEIVQFKTSYSAFGQKIRENYKLKFNKLNGACSKHSKDYHICLFELVQSNRLPDSSCCRSLCNSRRSHYLDYGLFDL